MSPAVPTLTRVLLRTLAFALFLGCVGWLVTVAILWRNTRQIVPVIQVRWAAQVSAEQRDRTAKDLFLALREPVDEVTARYYVSDATRENLGRIVLHARIEDTAFIDRESFALAPEAPWARTWIGDAYPALKSRGVLFLCLLGCLAGAVGALGDE